MIKRYGIFLIGLTFMSLGIVLIIKSALGTSPISSVPYVLSLALPLPVSVPLSQFSREHSRVHSPSLLNQQAFSSPLPMLDGRRSQQSPGDLRTPSISCWYS